MDVVPPFGPYALSSFVCLLPMKCAVWGRTHITIYGFRMSTSSLKVPEPEITRKIFQNYSATSTHSEMWHHSCQPSDINTSWDIMIWKQYAFTQQWAISISDLVTYGKWPSCGPQKLKTALTWNRKRKVCNITVSVSDRNKTLTVFQHIALTKHPIYLRSSRQWLWRLLPWCDAV